MLAGPCPLVVAAAVSLGEVERPAPLPSQEPDLWLSHLPLAPWGPGEALRGGEGCCRGADFLTFFPGSSRMVGRGVGALEIREEGDPKGSFGGMCPF